MKITFVLVSSGQNPVGGFKIVYEYANCLAARGHNITIVHPALSLTDAPFYWKTIKRIRYFQRKIDRSFLPNKWFKLDSRVNILWVPSLDQKNIPEGDVIIATAWQTAEWVANYPISKGQKYYFIQHWENWGCSEARLSNTWKLPLKKIVISRWLADIAVHLNESYIYIPNGLDFNAFNLDISIRLRNQYSVLMLYHEMKWKGTADGLEALSIVREKFPFLSVKLFGVSRWYNVPKWVTYYRNPDQLILRKLYNEAAIFVAPSWCEGWGLTASEAMMCGAALVATDIGGHREFTEHKITGLLAPPKQPSQLANHITYFLLNNESRISIANSGYLGIQKFTSERSCDTFEAVLLK